jgi:hypothetical protein
MTNSELYQVMMRMMQGGQKPNASSMVEVGKEWDENLQKYVKKYAPLRDVMDEKQLELLTGFNSGTQSDMALERQFNMNSDLADVNQNNSGLMFTEALGGQQRLPEGHDPLQYDYYKAGGGMGRHLMDDAHRHTGRWKKKPDPRLMAMHPNSPWLWDDYETNRMDMLMGLMRPGRQ